MGRFEIRVGTSYLEDIVMDGVEGWSEGIDSVSGVAVD